MDVFLLLGWLILLFWWLLKPAKKVFNLDRNKDKLDNIQRIREQLEQLEQLQTDIDLHTVSGRQLGLRIEWCSISGRKSQYDSLLNKGNKDYIQEFVKFERKKLTTSLNSEFRKIR